MRLRLGLQPSASMHEVRWHDGFGMSWLPGWPSELELFDENIPAAFGRVYSLFFSHGHRCWFVNSTALAFLSALAEGW